MFKMKRQATRSQTWGRETVRQGVKDRTLYWNDKQSKTVLSIGTTRSQRPYSLLERQGVKFQEMKLEQKTADTYLVGPSRRGAVCVRTKMI